MIGAHSSESSLSPFYRQQPISTHPTRNCSFRYTSVLQSHGIFVCWRTKVAVGIIQLGKEKHSLSGTRNARSITITGEWAYMSALTVISIFTFAVAQASNLPFHAVRSKTFRPKALTAALGVPVFTIDRDATIDNG
jgi:hypothetical protein